MFSPQEGGRGKIIRLRRKVFLARGENLLYYRRLDQVCSGLFYEAVGSVLPVTREVEKIGNLLGSKPALL